MSAVTKFIALSTTFCTSALVTLHLKFGVRFRNINFDADDSKNIENNDNIALPSKFSILSQNIWCSFIYGGQQRQQRLKLLVDNINKDNPDIICLQEMFIFALGPFMICGDFEYLHNELVHKLGYKYYSNPKQTLPLIFGGNNGLMIYSKYKLNACDSYSFNKNIRRSFSAKGWISAQIKVSELNNDTIHLINTHLEHSNRDYKLKQLDVITKQINDNDQYKICLGDFNICTNHTFEDKYSFPNRLYDILENGMKENQLKYDLFNSVERTFRITDKEPHSAYDHVFVDENIKNMIVTTDIMDYYDAKNDLVMSDHYGLMVNIDQNATNKKNV